MGLRVDTHIASSDASRLLSAAERPAGTRLRSGLRITSLANGSGLAPAERLRASVRSLDRERRGTDCGTSLQQKADTVLDEVCRTLTRVRELSAGSKSVGVGVAKTGERRG